MSGNVSNFSKLITEHHPSSSRVCSDCIGDKILKSEIKKPNYIGICDFCRKSKTVVPIDLISDWLHRIFQSNYTPRAGIDNETMTYEEWEGETAYEIISKILQSRNDEVHQEITNNFLEWSSASFSSIGQHSSAALYLPVRHEQLIQKWDHLCQELTLRFLSINNEIKDLLESIFVNFKRFESSEGELVKTITPGTPIYRGRLAKNIDSIKEILKSPDKGLGAPPRNFATAGRLNPAGVSVFYGALEAETCLAELRCPVGSAAVVGAFIPTRNLRLLDLTVFRSAFTDISHFDSNYEHLSASIEFIRELTTRISTPILPHDAKEHYRPTQLLFEYFAQLHDQDLDGIYFRSTQCSKDGYNVVLFERACGVEQGKVKYDCIIKSNSKTLNGLSLKLVEARESANSTSLTELPTSINASLRFSYRVALHTVEGITYQHSENVFSILKKEA